MSKARVLIVLTGALGDVFRAFEVATALAKQGAYEVHWLVDHRWDAIVERHPDVSKVWVLDRKSPVNSLRKLRAQLKAQSFDYCLDLQRNLKSGVLSWLSGAVRTIGFAPGNTREGNHFFHREYIPKRDWYFSKAEQYRDFGRALGCTFDQSQTTPFITETFASDLPDRLREMKSPWVALVLGSSRENKNWLAGGYARLLRLLQTRWSHPVVLLGTSDQIDLARRVSSAGDQDSVINLVGKTSLAELAAVLCTARICISPDSGAAHMAASFHTPTVILFGSTSVERVAPLGRHVANVRADVGCSPCERKSCRGLQNLCMRLIQPEEVFRRAEELLSGLSIAAAPNS